MTCLIYFEGKLILVWKQIIALLLSESRNVTVLTFSFCTHATQICITIRNSSSVRRILREFGHHPCPLRHKGWMALNGRDSLIKTKTSSGPQGPIYNVCNGVFLYMDEASLSVYVILRSPLWVSCTARLWRDVRTVLLFTLNIWHSKIHRNIMAKKTLKAERPKFIAPILCVCPCVVTSRVRFIQTDRRRWTAKAKTLSPLPVKLYYNWNSRIYLLWMSFRIRFHSVWTSRSCAHFRRR